MTELTKYLAGRFYRVADVDPVIKTLEDNCCKWLAAKDAQIDHWHRDGLEKQERIDLLEAENAKLKGLH